MKNKVMKANEMPERIYLFDYNEAMVTPLEGDTVYVREDAFIEKACEWIQTNMDDYIHVEYDTVTGMPTNEAHIANKKVVEDFVKFMKGE